MPMRSDSALPVFLTSTVKAGKGNIDEAQMGTSPYPPAKGNKNTAIEEKKSVRDSREQKSKQREQVEGNKLDDPEGGQPCAMF